HEYRLPPMHYGERQQSQREGAAGALFTHIKISNRGARALPIRRPSVERETLPEVAWIRVDWEVGGGPPESAVLGAGPSAAAIDLTLTIDLSEVSPQNHHSDRPLRATIRIESLEPEVRHWALPVVLQAGMRPALDSPLAIDLGHSNTYAVT